jgi:hypothetical protein
MGSDRVLGFLEYSVVGPWPFCLLVFLLVDKKMREVEREG